MIRVAIWAGRKRQETAYQAAGDLLPCLWNRSADSSEALREFDSQRTLNVFLFDQAI